MAKNYQVLPRWFKRNDQHGYLISKWCRKISNEEVLCIPCNKNITCTRKGFAALTQHASTTLHKDSLDIKLKPSQLLLKPREDNVDLPSTSADNLPLATLPLASSSTANEPEPPPKRMQLFSSREAATKAELIWVLKSVQCNMAATSADDLKDVFSAMFPSMPSDFQLGRTKLTYIITEALGPFFKKLLLCDAQKSYYTLLYDETTNSADKKELQFKIRFWSEAEDQVVVKHLKTVFLGHATAKDIYNEIEAVLNEANLPLSKLLMLGSDGPNVNKRVWNLVNESLTEMVERSKGLLDVGTCNLHIVNNAFLKGLEEFGEVACDLIIDIYHFFKKFPSRWDDYTVIQVKKNVPDHKFIKHVSSRWLTIGPALKRLLEQWPAIWEYFLVFIPRNEKRLMQIEKYKRILKYLKYVDMQVEINFVIESSELFINFSSIFQTSEPLVHILTSELKLILQKISGRICKPGTDSTKEITLEDLMEVRKVECGENTRKCLELLSEKNRLDALRKIQRHYMTSHNYLVKKLKFSILSYCECLQPEVILQDRSLELIGELSQALSLIGVSELNVKDEWRILQSEINLSDYEGIGRIDHFWKKIFDRRSPQGESRYPSLEKVVKAALCLSHGNSDVERGFSVSKRVLTEEKSCMSVRLLNDRLIIKDYISTFQNVAQVPITRELLNLAYNAHKSYDAFIKEQKRLKEMEETKNKEEEERKEQERVMKEQIENKKQSVQKLEKQIKQVAKEKKETQESADKLLEEANERLKEAIKKGNVTEMRIAQGMLEGAQQMRIKEREHETQHTKLNNIINKRKSSILDFVTKKPK